MKNFYHICHASHSEVIFRNHDDHCAFVNLMALSAYSESVDLLADVEMSTHIHQCAYCEDPERYLGILKQRYTRYFNHKYRRVGRLGERFSFINQIFGERHQQTVLSYVMRNPVHHGVTATPFAYPYSSTNELFINDLNKSNYQPTAISSEEASKYFPRHSIFPDTFTVFENGGLKRNIFMEISKCESFYKSSRSFLYNMNRPSSQEWQNEQAKDGVPGFINLSNVEVDYSKANIDEMLRNEGGFRFKYERMSDLDICNLIDNEYVRRYSAESIYLLSLSQRKEIYNEMLSRYSVNKDAVARCLIL